MQFVWRWFLRQMKLTAVTETCQRIAITDRNTRTFALNLDRSHQESHKGRLFRPLGTLTVRAQTTLESWWFRSRYKTSTVPPTRGANRARRWTWTKSERYLSLSPSYAWYTISQPLIGGRKARVLRAFLTTFRSGWTICGNWRRYNSRDEGFIDFY